MLKLNTERFSMIIVPVVTVVSVYVVSAVLAPFTSNYTALVLLCVATLVLTRLFRPFVGATTLFLGIPTVLNIVHSASGNEWTQIELIHIAGFAVTVLVFLRLAYIHNINTDTVKENLADKNEALVAKVKEAGAAKDLFLANVSHEIRTPLASILGFSEVIIKNNKLPEDSLQYMQVILRSAQHLRDMVDDLLDISKIESGKIDIERRDFLFTDLIDDVVKTMTMRAEQKGLTLDTLINHIPKIVYSDPTRTKQILFNLLSNAIKFTNAGGTVQLSVRLEFVRNKNYKLHLIVTDTGVGIKKEDQSKLFSPFSQADNTMGRRFGGTGLGLYVSKRLAEAMGGTLTLRHSTPDKGSCFACTLPVTVSEDLSILHSNAPSKKNLNGVKVLVVEDSEDNRLLDRVVLEGVGAKVDFAENGNDGVSKAIENDYCVVLMDIQMPGMDGKEATTKLRSMGYDKPIVALTAHALKTEKESALQNGFTDYLTKPINRQELINVLDKVAKEHACQMV